LTKVIEAKVYKPITGPFLEDEIRLMSRHRAEQIRWYGAQKVISEEMISDLQVDSEQELKNQILSLCQHYDSYPVLIELDNTTLNRTFIVDHMTGISDKKAIFENVYYAYTEKAKIIQASMDEKMERHRQQLQATLQQHGYSMYLFIDAITGGKAIPINEYLTDEEIEENLKEQHPRERAILLDIVKKFRGWAPRMYAEIASEFEIPVESFRTDDGLNPIYYSPYVIASKAEERDSQPLDINSVKYWFLEERGRIIGRVDAKARVDFQSWFTSFHLKMASNDTRYISNAQ
jgi:hypothetical protein